MLFLMLFLMSFFTFYVLVLVANSMYLPHTVACCLLNREERVANYFKISPHPPFPSCLVYLHLERYGTVLYGMLSITY